MIPKVLARGVALLLISCLVADSTFAQACLPAGMAKVDKLAYPAQSLFEEQALAPAVMSQRDAGEPFLNAYRTLKDLRRNRPGVRPSLILPPEIRREFPAARHKRPNHPERVEYQGVTYEELGALVPHSLKEQRIDEEKALALMLDPRLGVRKLIVEDYDEMTYVAAYLTLKLMELAQREFTWGLATGGTTESLRKVMGLFGLLRQIYGQIPAADKIVGVHTLDDYFWKRVMRAIREYAQKYGLSFLAAERAYERDVKLSSYREEQLYMLLRNFFAGLPEEKLQRLFVSPPQFQDSTREAGDAFRRDMRAFKQNRSRPLVVYEGIGAAAHTAFDEVPRVIIDLLETAISDLRALVDLPADLRRTDAPNKVLVPDRAVRIHETTQVQNAGHFIERRFHPFFLRFLGDHRLGDLSSLINRLSRMRFEEVATFYTERQYQFSSVKQYLKELDYLLKNYHRVPDWAITQGTGDMLERDFNPDTVRIVMSCGPHKARAVGDSSERGLTGHSSASMMHVAPNTMLIVTRDAASHMDWKDAFLFESQNPNRRRMSEQAIEKTWQETPEGRRVTELLREPQKGTDLELGASSSNATRLQPLPYDAIRVTVDDFADTLVAFWRGGNKRPVGVTPEPLLEDYRSRLRKEGCQVIVTGDELSEIEKWWMAPLTEGQRDGPFLRSRIIVLSVSSTVGHRFDPQTGKPVFLFDLRDILDATQGANWEAFRQEWMATLQTASEIYLGPYRRKSDHRETYRYEKGHLDDRAYQLTLFVADSHGTIDASEVATINQRLAAAKARLGGGHLLPVPPVRAGESRRDAMMAYLQTAFQAPSFKQLGFSPVMTPIRGNALDTMPIHWKKGHGLAHLKEMGIVDSMLMRPLDWAREVEIHGDGFEKSNDRDMAEALPTTPAVSVGDEDEELCPLNVTVYRGTTPETRKGPTALLESLETRKQKGLKLGGDAHPSPRNAEALYKMDREIVRQLREAPDAGKLIRLDPPPSISLKPLIDRAPTIEQYYRNPRAQKFIEFHESGMPPGLDPLYGFDDPRFGNVYVFKRGHFIIAKEKPTDVVKILAYYSNLYGPKHWGDRKWDHLEGSLIAYVTKTDSGHEVIVEMANEVGATRLSDSSSETRWTRGWDRAKIVVKLDENGTVQRVEPHLHPMSLTLSTISLMLDYANLDQVLPELDQAIRNHLILVDVGNKMWFEQHVDNITVPLQRLAEVRNNPTPQLTQLHNVPPETIFSLSSLNKMKDSPMILIHSAVGFKSRQIRRLALSAVEAGWKAGFVSDSAMRSLRFGVVAKDMREDLIYIERALRQDRQFFEDTLKLADHPIDPHSVKEAHVQFFDFGGNKQVYLAHFQGGFTCIIATIRHDEVGGDFDQTQIDRSAMLWRRVQRVVSARIPRLGGSHWFKDRRPLLADMRVRGLNYGSPVEDLSDPDRTVATHIQIHSRAYVPGWDLLECLHDNSISYQTKQRWIRESLRAYIELAAQTSRVSATEEKPVYLGDPKPANVVISAGDEAAWLIDFDALYEDDDAIGRAIRSLLSYQAYSPALIDEVAKSVLTPDEYAGVRTPIQEEVSRRNKPRPSEDAGFSLGASTDGSPWAPLKEQRFVLPVSLLTWVFLAIPWLALQWAGFGSAFDILGPPLAADNVLVTLLTHGLAVQFLGTKLQRRFVQAHQKRIQEKIFQNPELKGVPEDAKRLAADAYQKYLGQRFRWFTWATLFGLELAQPLLEHLLGSTAVTLVGADWAPLALSLASLLLGQLGGTLLHAVNNLFLPWTRTFLTGQSLRLGGVVHEAHDRLKRQLTQSV